MIATDQHRGHRLPFEHFRPRVVRPVEQPGDERILDCRSLVTQHARQQPDHRVDQHQRRQLAPDNT